VPYPRLGLPLSLELVNTTFVSDGQPADALQTPAHLDAWLHTNRLRQPADAASTAADVERFRALRAALRRIFSAAFEASRPPTEDLDVLNAASAAAPQYSQLAWDDRPRIVRSDTSALGSVARDAIDVLGGPNLKLITPCQAPGCVLFFLREPRRRHWCSAACGNRARVARHYARRRSARVS